MWANWIESHIRQLKIRVEERREREERVSVGGLLAVRIGFGAFAWTPSSMVVSGYPQKVGSLQITYPAQETSW